MKVLVGTTYPMRLGCCLSLIRLGIVGNGAVSRTTIDASSGAISGTVARDAVIWNGKRLIPRARSTARSAALALMASVAEFVIRLTGQCAINAHLQYELQLPNRRKRAEISVIRVGMLILRDAFRDFNDAAFRKTIKQWASAHPVFSI